MNQIIVLGNIYDETNTFCSNGRVYSGGVSHQVLGPHILALKDTFLKQENLDIYVLLALELLMNSFMPASTYVMQLFQTDMIKLFWREHGKNHKCLLYQNDKNGVREKITKRL